MNQALRSIREAATLARTNQPLLVAKVKTRARRMTKGTLPDRWRIGGVLFAAEELAHEPAVASTLKAMFHGNYETPTRCVLRRYLKPGGIFVDVGANIGYFSSLGASLVGTAGTIHAFEPVPQYAAHLRTLQKNNPHFSILVNQFALGDCDDSATIDVAGPRNIGWNSLIPDAVDRGYRSDGTTVPRHHALQEQVVVAIKRFDDYAASRELDRIDLVKIDVEGFELNVLRGMEATLTRTHPPIVCEISPHLFERIGVTADILESWMESNGYRAVDVVHYRPVQISRIFSASDQQNILLLPTSDTKHENR